MTHPGAPGAAGRHDGPVDSPDDMAARMKKIVDDYFEPKPATPEPT